MPILGRLLGFSGVTTYNHYFHTDALGSITAITNDAGTVIERRSYEPFGKIRAMDYGTNNNTLANLTTQSTRAFTGHEQISEISGLIHMNARVYDSDIGRFLSADTIIQDPHDSQSYNRYSYVRNNPMVFTDPSGHSWFSKLWDKIGTYVIAVVVAVIAVYTGGLALMSMTGASTVAAASGMATISQLAVAGAVGGFAAGVSAGLLGGASLGDSLQMGMQGAAYGAIGAVTAGYIGGIKSGIIRASLHGITRAAISKAQGGKWSAGFWSGFASSALAPLASSASTFEGKIAMSAIVGGTASELGGGKFANGAVTGAFVMMYNEMGHTYPSKKDFIYVKDRIDLNREALLKGAQDGHLTLDEAIAWYRYGNGTPLSVDASKLTVLDLQNRDIVLGADYWVHGQVTLRSDGSIAPGPYDFDMHGTGNFDDGYLGIRDYATKMGHMYIGGQGKSYMINYYNQAKIR